MLKELGGMPCFKDCCKRPWLKDCANFQKNNNVKKTGNVCNVAKGKQLKISNKEVISKFLVEYLKSSIFI